MRMMRFKPASKTTPKHRGKYMPPKAWEFNTIPAEDREWMAQNERETLARHIDVHEDREYD
jgi:hypothetical protein